ncbi:MAG TPA: transglycosylase SLT domain-containing protein [Myxococcaceae bacterium]|nr:transglycosylase SLT domain-containing protein [Myxococcaceae bacterium]
MLLHLVALLLAAAPETTPATPTEPAPDVEQGLVPDDVAEVWNPAFPSAPPAVAAAPTGHRLELRTLDPVFTGELAAPRAEFEAGRYERTLQLLAKVKDTPAVRYLRVLSRLRMGPAPAQAAEMEALATELPAIADRCRLQAGLAREDLGELEAAARLFAAVPPTSRVYPDARFGLARIMRRQGDLRGAAEVLEPLARGASPLWGRDVAAEALVTQADLARARRDAEAERQALLTLWSTHPRSPLAAQAERRLGKAALTVPATVARAESLVELHRNRQGLDVLRPVLPKLKIPDPLACRARLVEGRALRKERRHAEVQEVLQTVVRGCTDPDLRVRALYLLGTSQSVVAPASAVKTFDALAKEFPENPLADDALFVAADLLAQDGDTAGALSRLDRIAERYPEGDQLGEALFKAFWLRHGAGDEQAALAALTALESARASAEESYDVERARYWRARALDQAKRTDQAVALWETLALEHPGTYYGLMARERLAERDPVRASRVAAQLAALPPAATPTELEAGTLLEDPHFLAGAELLRLGFNEAASSELLAARRTGQPPEAQHLLVEAVARTGDVRSAHGVARLALRRELSGPVAPASRELWAIAYPDAFRDLVVRYTKGSPVEPELLQALMREESALDPRALSWAGAVGLTQLMVPTAREVARSLRIRAPSAEQLQNPSTNIQLGAAYLARLLQRFDGNVALALASYNAGEGAVTRWRSARPESELDRWVEEIPLSETRGYVKRVLRSWNTYRLLGGRPLPGVVKTTAPAAPRAEREQ